MKKALIQGSRICQVTDAEFPVHPSLQWVDVPDDTTERDTYVNGAVVKEPQKPAPTPIEVIGHIEMTNPITHRALRELILTIGEAFPAGKNTVFYQRVLATEQLIQAERAKL